ncbi:hypothetical protein M378DRAFT_182686 [Amanita muscaria Koide BX008]|uniref:Uncharacterized protein n=1 Tax=Amanita muscaria (strain Koide BX008) TaxID=946122 RepID=A0A0C2VYX2_AMAMK|nr:hypothetical protein M378DRAFT_182686 [Amanita muscaria Koide BX008]
MRKKRSLPDQSEPDQSALNHPNKKRAVNPTTDQPKNIWDELARLHGNYSSPPQFSHSQYKKAVVDISYFIRYDEIPLDWNPLSTDPLELTESALDTWEGWGQSSLSSSS